MKKFKIETSIDAGLITVYKDKAKHIIDQIYSKIESEALAGCTFTTINLPDGTTSKAADLVCLYFSSKGFKVNKNYFTDKTVKINKRHYRYTLTINWL